MRKYLILFVAAISLTSCLEDKYRKTTKESSKIIAIPVAEALNAGQEEAEKQKEIKAKEKYKQYWESECKNEKGEIIKNKIIAKGKEKPKLCEEIFKE